MPFKRDHNEPYPPEPGLDRCVTWPHWISGGTWRSRHWRTVHRDQTLDYVNITTCIFHLYVKTIIWPFIYKKVVFHAFLVAMMFAVIKLVPGLFVCLYITLQCWKVLSCLLFLSRLIYLRRLWLGNCQSNIFYIVIFAQLLLREIWNGNMFYEYETIEAIWVWAHAKVYVKELEKNIIQSDTFEMGRCYFNVYIYYFFLQLVPHELCWSVTAVCIKNEFISAMIHLYGK